MTVEVRTTPSSPTIESITRCRSALLRATTLHSMSPAPVMVCASSTSAIAASRSATGSCPPACLPDLQGDEGHDLVADRGWLDVRAVASDDTPSLHPVEPGLNSPPRDAKPSAGLEHAYPRLVQQEPDQPPVEAIYHRS